MSECLSAMQIIQAGWLIDGSGGPIQQDVCIRLCGERIEAIKAEAAQHAAAGPPAVSMRDMTVMPALIDAHVHLALPGTAGPARREDLSCAGAQQMGPGIEERLRRYFRCGIAAVRDGGDRHGAVLRFKKRVSGQDLPLVDLSAAGWAWHAPGRYGTAIGRAVRHPELLTRELEGLISDIDHLKVIQSGMNSLDRFGLETAPQFTARQLRGAVALARAHNRASMVHANGKEPVAIAIEAGCSSLEHGYFMGPENLQRLCDQGIWWVPTVTPMASLCCSRTLSAAQRDVARRTRDHQLEQIARAVQWGGRIALGTDAGSPGVAHGRSVRHEMQWLINAGMSLEQAIGSATHQTAQLLGWQRRGAVLPGFQADLIAVRGTPADLPGSLESIHGICRRGRWYYSGRPI